MDAARVRAQVHASKLMTIKYKLEHASRVIEHVNFKSAREKQAFICNSALASMKLEMSCTVYVCSKETVITSLLLLFLYMIGS